LFGIDPLLIAGLVVLGACTGFAAGLLGVGGGMMMVPFITMILTQLAFPAEQIVKVAVATSLASILFTSIASVRAHHRRGAVRWDIVRMVAPGIVVGSVLGAQFAAQLKGALLAALFAGFVGFSATQMLTGKKPSPSRTMPGPGGSAAAGGFVGFLSAIVGAGGGFISVPLMTLCNVPIHQAVATSAALGFPIAVAGTIGYVIAGWHLSLPLAVGYIWVPALAAVSFASVLTAPLGARAAHALPVASLKRIFAVILYVLAGYMVWRALQG
jgi:uncharacterized membrane protein YfcA